MGDEWSSVDWSLVDFGDEPMARRAKALPVSPVETTAKRKRGRPPKVRIDDANSVRIDD
jgi:hypothetical protein